MSKDGDNFRQEAGSHMLFPNLLKCTHRLSIQVTTLVLIDILYIWLSLPCPECLHWVDDLPIAKGVVLRIHQNDVDIPHEQPKKKRRRLIVVRIRKLSATIAALRRNLATRQLKQQKGRKTEVFE